MYTLCRFVCRWSVNLYMLIMQTDALPWILIGLLWWASLVRGHKILCDIKYTSMFTDELTVAPSSPATDEAGLPLLLLPRYNAHTTEQVIHTLSGWCGTALTLLGVFDAGSKELRKIQFINTYRFIYLYIGVNLNVALCVYRNVLHVFKIYDVNRKYESNSSVPFCVLLTFPFRSIPRFIIDFFDVGCTCMSHHQIYFRIGFLTAMFEINVWKDTLFISKPSDEHLWLICTEQLMEP